MSIDITKMTKKELIEEVERLNQVIKNMEKNHKEEVKQLELSRDTNSYLAVKDTNEIKELRKELAETKEELFQTQSKLTEATCRYELLQETVEREKSVKNPRGAGRKKKFDNYDINEILEARKENKSMRAIAKEFNCSLGLVQKIISEHTEKENKK